MTDALNICILVEQPYLAQAQPAGLCEALRARGHRVTLMDPQATCCEIEGDDWLAGFDGVIARGQSWPLLSLLTWAERRGLPVINRCMAIAAIHNKADMAVALATAHIPTPRTFLGAKAELMNQVPTAIYPIMFKPIFGDNGQSLRVVNTPEELRDMKWPEPLALAQQYLRDDGYNLKLYGIGDEVWAVRQPSPFRIPNGKAAKIEVQLLTPELGALGQRCGSLFGLELYGVDCIETADGPVVVGINDFPDYTGVPDVDDRLAEYCLRRIQHHHRRMNHKNWRDPAAPSANGHQAQSDFAGSRAMALSTGRESRSYLH